LELGDYFHGFHGVVIRCFWYEYLSDIFNSKSLHVLRDILRGYGAAAIWDEYPAFILSTDYIVLSNIV
jgi:hypothetical protein